MAVDERPWILDVDKRVARMTDEERGDLVEKVRNDFHNARDTRSEREERALDDYALYSRKRRDAIQQAEDRGGWSTLEVPLVFWIVEHELPRLGVQPPTITVTARKPAAVAYAQAKQMRLQHYLDRCGWDIPYQMIQRSKIIIGDGISKVPWDASEVTPRILHVDWFDFFFSAEATVAEKAEVYFHRTYWTRRQLAALAEDEDADGRPLWHGLEDLAAVGDRSSSDSTWARRRDISWQGPGGPAQRGAGEQIPMIEAWYASGEYVVLAGNDFGQVVRAQMSPFRRRSRDGEKVYVRPFAFFRNVPDLTGPYSIGEATVLEDHQIEISTLRNQYVDQTTANLNAPVIHDENIPGAEVEKAFQTPKGFLGVPWGPGGPGIQRLQPGYGSGDMDRIYAWIRDEAQIISGMNDNAAGQAVEGQQTATEVGILAAEANKRMQLKRRMDEIAMGDVGRLFDSHDRQFGTIMDIPVDRGFTPRDGAQGFAGPPGAASFTDMMAGRGAPEGTPDFSSGFARIGIEVNGADMDYDIEVDAGSSMRPDQSEEAQKINAFILGPASHAQIGPRLDWAELTRRVIEVHGLSDERLMLPPAPPAPAGPAPPPDAAANGAGPGPGEVVIPLEGGPPVG